MSTDSLTQNAFDKYFHADGTVFRPRAERAIEWRAKHPLSKDVVLTWEPELVDASGAGDFAYTTGPQVSGGRSGRIPEHFGQYVNVWRKQKDGRWLVIVNGSVLTPFSGKNPDKLKSPTIVPFAGARGSAAAEKTTLLNADNNFAALLKKRAYGEALKPIAASEIRLLRNTMPLTTGTDSIISQTRGARMTMWMPVEAVVAASADLGYTRGSYVVALPSGRNEAGDYLRIWRRDKTGTWLVALDMLSPGR
jgi:ketosteroid isomerase-like protein